MDWPTPLICTLSSPANAMRAKAPNRMINAPKTDGAPDMARSFHSGSNSLAPNRTNTTLVPCSQKNETEWVYFYRTIRVSRGARSPNVAVVVRENLEAPPDTGGFTLPPNRAACQHHQHVTDEPHTITAMTSPTPLSGVGYKTRHVVGCGTCEKRHTRSHTNTHAHTCAEKCLCFGPLTGSQPYWSSSMQSMHMRGSGPTRLAEPARASVPPLIAAVLGAPASGAVTGDVGTKPSKLASEAEMEGVCAEEARLA
jgi:hypothetical protein